MWCSSHIAVQSSGSGSPCMPHCNPSWRQQDSTSIGGRPRHGRHWIRHRFRRPCQGHTSHPPGFHVVGWAVTNQPDKNQPTSSLRLQRRRNPAVSTYKHKVLFFRSIFFRQKKHFLPRHTDRNTAHISISLPYRYSVIPKRDNHDISRRRRQGFQRPRFNKSPAGHFSSCLERPKTQRIASDQHQAQGHHRRPPCSRPKRPLRHDRLQPKATSLLQTRGFKHGVLQERAQDLNLRLLGNISKGKAKNWNTLSMFYNKHYIRTFFCYVTMNGFTIRPSRTKNCKSWSLHSCK